jgi:hypothetical protein
MMTIRPRVSIRLTLVLIALIGGILAVVRWNDPVVRYRRDHDESSLNTVMSRRVAAGDTVESIESLLGPGKHITDPGWRRSVAAFVARAPSGYPDGLDPEDEFRGFASGPGNSTILQFRDGHLINFKPSDFVGTAATFAGASK